MTSTLTWEMCMNETNSDLDTLPTLYESRRLAEACWPPTAPSPSDQPKTGPTAPTASNKRPHSPSVEPKAKKARMASRPETKTPLEQEPFRLDGEAEQFRRDAEKAWKRQDKEAEKQEQYRQEMKAHAKKQAEKEEKYRQEMKAHAKKEAEKQEEFRRAAEKAWKQQAKDAEDTRARLIEEAKNQKDRWDATAHEFGLVLSGIKNAKPDDPPAAPASDEKPKYATQAEVSATLDELEDDLVGKEGPRQEAQRSLAFAVTKSRHDVEKIMGQAIRSQTWSNLFKQRKFAERFYLLRVEGSRRETRAQKRRVKQDQVADMIRGLSAPIGNAHSYIVLVTPDRMWNIVRTAKTKLGYETCTPHAQTRFRQMEETVFLQDFLAANLDILAYYLEPGSEDDAECESFVEGKSYFDVADAFYK